MYQFTANPLIIKNMNEIHHSFFRKFNLFFVNLHYNVPKL